MYSKKLSVPPGLSSRRNLSTSISTRDTGKLLSGSPDTITSYGSASESSSTPA